MSNYCKECSIAIFGEDCKELSHILPENEYTNDKGALALCECCGPVVVNYEGKRMSKAFSKSCNCAEIAK